jgi:hypothetical protein
MFGHKIPCQNYNLQMSAPMVEVINNALLDQNTPANSSNIINPSSRNNNQKLLRKTMPHRMRYSRLRHFLDNIFVGAVSEFRHVVKNFQKSLSREWRFRQLLVRLDLAFSKCIFDSPSCTARPTSCKR